MLISFSKAVVSDSPLLRNLHSYHSIRHSTKPKTEKTFRCESNLIRDRQIQHSCRSIISDRKKFSRTLTLSFFGFGLFRETNSAHAVMTSLRLHFTLDKTALTCCIQSLKDMQSLQSAALRSSCTSVPRGGLQSYDAYGDIRAQCKKSTCRHSQESVHSGRDGGAYIEHSGRQHDHQCHEHQELRNSITFKPIRDYSQLGFQSLQNISSHIFAGFLVPSIFAIFSKPICTRF